MFPKQAQESILRSEGGYVNRPDDPGGETKYGISKRAYPSLDIKNLTKEAALAIYERDYWNAMKLDLLPPGIALLVFDFGVNAGRGRAVKKLQEVVGVPQDGALGPATARAVAGCTDVLQKYTDARKAYYKALNKPQFETGWLTRCDRALAESKGIPNGS